MWRFFSFLFFPFLSFVLSFLFFCSFLLSFLLHTSRGRKAVPWGLHIDERDVRRIDRERDRLRETDQKAEEWSSLVEENEKIKFESPVLSFPFLFVFPLKLLNSHPYSSLPTNPQQFIPNNHIHQSQSHTLINHISPRQPPFQTRILL